VQTVALRLIVEREQESLAFVPQEYWTIHAMLDAGQPPLFEAKLFKYKGEDIEVKNQEAADKVVAAVTNARWQVANNKKKEAQPAATFWPQDAAGRFAKNVMPSSALSSPRNSMRRWLGEGSSRLSPTCAIPCTSRTRLAQVHELIQMFRRSYLPESQTGQVQKEPEAHEAVRSTDALRAPEDVRKYLDDYLFKLYQLIWQRFVASQMLPAIFDQTTIDIRAGDYTFRATGSVQKFDGYLRVYQLPASARHKAKRRRGEGKSLPQVSEGQSLRLDKIRPDQHFTEPPPRYNDATLVKDLEEKGIGRPSTYASIISTIVEREYVTKDHGRFLPTMLGERVSVLLVKSFEDIFDVTFTARLEEELDEIEEATPLARGQRVLGKVRR
jgi:DNA topoisomerase-1